jgi:hypothetical protein
MKAVAVRKGQTRERAPGLERGALFAVTGGEKFVIVHDPAFWDSTLAEEQAHWLRKCSRRGARTRAEAPGSNPVAGIATNRLKRIRGYV